MYNMKLRGLSHDLAALVWEGKATRTEQKGGVVYIITDEKEAIRLAEGLKDIKRDPNPSLANPRSNQNEREKTMEDFWIEQGWFKTMRGGIKLVRAKWDSDPAIMNGAVKFLVEEVLGKDPRDMTREDFISNRLSGLLSRYYNQSPYAALSEVYPEIKPWEMVVTPLNYFNEEENRIAAIKWLVEERLKKDPRDISKDDFHNNRLSGLLAVHYKNSPYAAIIEVYPEVKPWEMADTPKNYFDDRSNRVVAIRWLVEGKLKKDPRDITNDDFDSNRLVGLFGEHYGKSTYAAISEAYPEIKPWEMIKTPQSYFDDRSNRVKAIKWLVEERLKKDPREVTTRDFYENRLAGLFHNSYGGSPHAVISDAYPEVKPWEMTKTPRNYFDDKALRITAIRWLVEERLRRDPREVTTKSFENNGLGGLLNTYYNYSPYAAISDAYPEIKLSEMRNSPKHI